MLEAAALLTRLEQEKADGISDIERLRLAAYRQARVFEPSMEGYYAAMSVYSAAFGKPEGEIGVLIPDGSTKQAWEMGVAAEAQLAEAQQTIEGLRADLALAHDANQFYNRKAADAIVLRKSDCARAEALEARVSVLQGEVAELKKGRGA